jgi:hypothetical protein
MGFKEIRALIIEALKSDRVRHEGRADADDKNLLSAASSRKTTWFGYSVDARDGSTAQAGTTRWMWIVTSSPLAWEMSSGT